MGAAPVLEEQSRDAVDHRGSHVQIIASAGSGKTEVVSQSGLQRNSNLVLLHALNKH